MNNRTHMCGEVTAEVAGQSVILKGWVQRARNLGGIVFVWLRDRTGIVQVVFDGNDISKELLELAESLRSEYVIEVHGQARMRAPEAVNKKLKTGEVEVVAESAVILNASKTPPIYIEDDTKEQESLRLKYRYLDLRRPSMQNMLLFRHKVIKLLRDYMDEQGFIEVETPILSKSTPEGARDYLVPARVKPGTFYALPQSPQIYKQLLMLAGLDKYYQVARCFRDEDGRADRQPEFTQFDMEMSFIDPEDIQTVVEGAYAHVFKELMGVELSLPLRRITWRDAMARYGSDKPDTRFGMEIQDVSEVVAGCGFRVFEEALAAGNTICAICAGGAGHLSRKELDALGEFVKTYHVKGLAWAVVNEDGTLRSSFAKAMQGDSMQRLLETLKGQPNVTKDGKSIRIYCNIGSPDDVHAVQVNDGGGIGLFRSEFLYLNSPDYPTEDQQFEAYKKVLADMGGKEVIIRTLDIGADKQIGYFNLPKEDNPAMGMRALRICLTRPEIFKTQLRALYRASAFGKLGIMFPMVTSVWEVREAKKYCEEVKRDLKAEGIPFAEDVQVGIMIETPAAAIMSDRLAKEVDFFSCGTNDLTQYTLACDRQNNDLGRFYDPHNPAVLRLLKMVTENAHKNGIWVGICGELGADLTLTETFLAIGVDELSVSPRAVLPLRNAVRMTDTRESAPRLLAAIDAEYPETL